MADGAQCTATEEKALKQLKHRQINKASCRQNTPEAAQMATVMDVSRGECKAMDTLGSQPFVMLKIDHFSLHFKSRWRRVCHRII